VGVEVLEYWPEGGLQRAEGALAEELTKALQCQGVWVLGAELFVATAVAEEGSGGRLGSGLFN